MAEKLRYDVEVNTRDGVSELERLGKAGKEAGDEIADGFDETESAAKSVAAALVAAAQDIEQALKADAEAADALGQALGPELSGKIDTSAAVQEFKKLGLSAEDVKGEADTLALALKEVDDISMASVKGDMTKLGGAVDDVDSRVRKMGDTSDNSRSVMANLAGNAAQDNFTALGGAAGSAGVAIGQLAEYASEGNISMSGLAAVAGPMLLLAGATQLVTSRMERVAKIDAWRKEQVEGYRDAVSEVGIGVGAIETHLRTIDDWTFDTGGDWHDFLTSEGKLNDIAAALGVMGFTVNELSGYINSGSAGADQFEARLAEVGLTGNAAGIYLDYLTAQQDAYTEATANASAESKFFAQNIDSANAHLTEFLDKEDPMRSFTEQWATLMADIADGNISTQEAADAMTTLANGLGLTEDEIIQIAQARLDERMAGIAEATEAAAAATERNTEALEAEVSAMQAAAEEAERAADAQRAAVDSVYALESAQEGLNDARTKYLDDADEYGDTSVEATRSLRDVRDAAIDVADAEVQLARDRAASNRVTYTTVQAIDDENAALLDQAATLQGPERQAILTHIAAVNDIPTDVMTEIATLVDQGKYDEAQALLDDVSGRRNLAIEAQVDEHAARTAKNQLDGIAADRDSEIRVLLNTEDAKARLRQLMTLIYGAQQSARRIGVSAPQSAAPPPGPTPAPTVVTLNLPRGTRPDDAVRAIDNYARRNGSTRARR
jgi:hypothetical protein